MSIFDGLETEAGTAIILHFEDDSVRKRLENENTHSSLQAELNQRIKGSSARVYDIGEGYKMHILFNTDGRFFVFSDNEYVIWQLAPETDRNWGHLDTDHSNDPSSEDMAKYSNDPTALTLSMVAAYSSDCEYCLVPMCFNRHASFDPSVMEQKIQEVKSKI